MLRRESWIACAVCVWMLAACDRPAGGPLAPPALSGGAPDEPAHPLSGYEAHFVLTWQGARIGHAAESLRRLPEGWRFHRREQVSVRRGDALVHTELQITAITDHALSAHEIAISQVSGQARVRGHARRDARGDWVVRYGHEPARTLPGDAVLVELVPLILAARPDTPGFSGRVLLPGAGFATAHLEVRARGERTRVAELVTPHGSLRGTWTLTQQRTLARAVAGDGVVAARVPAAALRARFEPPEIVDASSVPVRAAPAGQHGDRALVLEPVTRAAPPPLPGQRVAVADRTWRVWLAPGDAPAQGDMPAPGDSAHLGPDEPARPDPVLADLARRLLEAAGQAAGSARAEAMILARATPGLLQPDLGATVSSARAALDLGRGDCTAYALIFAGLAHARGIPARLVTGFRLEESRLVRHRWVIVHVDGAWLAVDPTHGEAPAAPRLLGLAVHEASAADMALADELAFAGLAGVRAWR